MANDIEMKRRYEEEAQSWCLKKGITIYVIPTSPLRNAPLQIIVNYQGSKYPGEKLFDPNGGKANDEKWWLEIKKLYVYYYEKEFINK